MDYSMYGHVTIDHVTLTESKMASGGDADECKRKV